MRVTFLLAAFALAGQVASAAPVVSVRARTTLKIDPIRRTDDGVRVSGQVTDRLTGDPVSDVGVQISIDELGGTTATDSTGRFSRVVTGLGEKHDLSVEFEGSAHFEGSKIELDGFEISKQPLILSISASPGDNGIEVIVRANSEGRPVSLRAELYGGVADDVAAIGKATTDENGRAEVVLPRSSFGPAGRKRIVARFRGDDLYDPAADQAFFVITTRATLSLSVSDDSLAFEAKLVGVGVLRDDDGNGIAGAVVSLRGQGRKLGDAITDAAGKYSLRLSASELGPGQFKLQTVFEPPQTWFTPARSELVEVTIDEPRPVPVGYTLAAFGATAAVFLTFVGLRTKPWLRWRAHPGAADLPDPVRPTKGPVRGGLAESRSGLMSTIRRANDHSFTGVVTNGVTHKPIHAAAVYLDASGDSRSTHTDSVGHFALEALADGEWSAVVSSHGYVTERFRVTVPHRGELRDARVDLVPVRERIFDLYRQAAAPALPDTSLWGVWTPRQIVDHVAERAVQGGTVALAELTQFVEESYFSQRTPDEALLPRARDLVAEAVAEGQLPTA